MPQIKGRRTEADGGDVKTQSGPREPYARPDIVLELELETRAGSPLMMDPLVDPFDPPGSEEKK